MPDPVRRYATGAGEGGRGGRGGGDGGGGRKRRRGGGAPTGGNPLNALLSRAGRAMDFQMESAEREIPRQEKAFDYYSRGRESELEDADLNRRLAKREVTHSRQRELAGGKEKREAAVKADPRYGTSDAGAVLQQNQSYLDELAGANPWDAMYTRHSRLRNLPAAGTMAGINFPGWLKTAGESTRNVGKGSD